MHEMPHAAIKLWKDRVAVFAMATVDQLGMTTLSTIGARSLREASEDCAATGRDLRTALARWGGFVEYADFQREHYGHSPERDAFGASDRQLPTLFNQCGQVSVEEFEDESGRGLRLTVWVTRRGIGEPAQELELPFECADADLGAQALAAVERSLAATEAARSAPAKGKRGG